MSRSRCRGMRSAQALVEFALTLPVFLVLMLSMVDLGLGVYAFNTVSFGAQEGMRRGITLGKDCGAFKVAGNMQNYSGTDPTWSDGVEADTSAQQTFTTSTITSPVRCTANTTERSTIVGAVNKAAGILNRGSVKVVIETAPGGTTGTYTPVPGEDLKVWIVYRHTPIWGLILADGLTRMTGGNYSIDMRHRSTGQVQ